MPETANEVLFDHAVAHQIDLTRYATATVKRIIRLLDEADPDLVAKIKASETDTWTTKRLQALLDAIRTINKGAYQAVAKELKGALKDLAAAEGEYQAGAIQGAIPVDFDVVSPSAPQLVAAAEAKPFSGKLLKEWVADMEANRFKSLQGAIRMGVVEGESVDQIAKRVTGTKALNYKDGILEASRRSAEAIVRTAVNHTATAAREQLYAENEDLIKGVRWVSTLDLRTTAICQARDGKVYPPKEGPRPPAHINALAAGTAITTARGSVPIEQVRCGDLVLTHRGRWRPVYATMSKVNEKAQIRRIHVSSGRVLRTTDEHPVLCRRLGWKHADQVDVGDQLFQDPESVPEADCSARARVVEPHHYPAEFHEREVFSEVTCAPGTVSASVDFKAHLLDRESEIEDVSGHRELEFERGPGRFKVSADRFLGRAKLTALLSRDALSDFLAGLGVPCRVALTHAEAVGRHMGVVGLCAPKVVVGEAPALDCRIRPDKGSRRALAPNYNAVPTAPTVEYASPKAVVSLDLANRLARAEMLARDQIRDDRSVSQIHPAPQHWRVPTCTSIAFEPYDGRVYNLAVVDDETYLAEGLIVHNCRSTTVPVTKSWNELGIDMEEVPEGTRASMDGQVPATLTYEEWLRKKPPEVQDKVLGKAKGKLFRDGGLSLDKFVDLAGKEATLADIKKFQKGAFIAAGVEAPPKPNPADTFTKVGEANIGGTKAKEFWDDGLGNRWLFKPAQANAPFIPYGEQAAAQVGALVKPSTIEVRAKTLGGKFGSIQRFEKGSQDFHGTPQGQNPVLLSAAQRAQIQTEHVIDWAVSNHDAHAGNFIVNADGQIVGIDKGQAGKHLGQDKLSVDYHPNAAYGEKPPYYNGFWKAARDGKIDPDLSHTYDAIAKLQAIPDTQYREMWRPYAEERFKGDKAGADAFLNKVLARKASLKDDFDAFFDKLGVSPAAKQAKAEAEALAAQKAAEAAAKAKAEAEAKAQAAAKKAAEDHAKAIAEAEAKLKAEHDEELAKAAKAAADLQAKYGQAQAELADLKPQKPSAASQGPEYAKVLGFADAKEFKAAYGFPPTVLGKGPKFDDPKVKQTYDAVNASFKAWKKSGQTPTPAQAASVAAKAAAPAPVPPAQGIAGPVPPQDAHGGNFATALGYEGKFVKAFGFSSKLIGAPANQATGLTPAKKDALNAISAAFQKWKQTGTLPPHSMMADLEKKANPPPPPPPPVPGKRDPALGRVADGETKVMVAPKTTAVWNRVQQDVAASTQRLKQSAFRNSIPSGSKGPWESYIESGYISWNAALRSANGAVPAAYKNKTAALDRAFAGQTIPHDVRLWRGTRYFKGIESLDGAMALKGSTIQDHGYFSSSAEQSVSKGFQGYPEKPPAPAVLFTIRAKAGTTAIPGTGGEAEYIWPRGSKFRVLDVEVIDHKSVHILIEPA